MVEHNIILRGLRGMPTAIAGSQGPTILQRTDQDFIAAILDELTEGVDEIGRTLAHTHDAEGTLKLFQPVHRTFHVALLEVVCNPFSHPALQPRLDPQRIESAGLVIRRLAVNQQGRSLSNQLEGWRQENRILRGWVPFATEALDLDPDPTRRRHRLSAGHPELNRRLSLLQRFTEHFSETTSPLFVAPPAVCQAAKRTLLYGVIPTTSSELSEATTDNSFTSDFIREHLPTYLRTASGTKLFPRPNERLSAQDAADLDRLLSDTDPNVVETDPDLREERLLRDFINLLRQLQFEFEAFSDRADARELFAALNQIQLPYDDDGTEPAGTFLKQAARVLLDRVPGQSVQMPSRWAAVSSVVGDRIANAVKAILERRLDLAQPQTRRFDALNRHYQIRAFIRVKQPDGCPPELIWSVPSPPFAIAPWYANSDAPPVQVALPDILNPATLQTLKPSVAFAVPSDLFNALNGMNLQDLLDGKKPSGGGIALDWICSFNIPIITLCAFIVLNIFLQLLNFIFQWLLFIKICIPIPRREGG